jgi:signal transduction histidine kinase
LYLEIEDNGQGMSDDDLNNLYNSFKKLSSKPTAGESSTGLGLSIVKYLVDLCGGQILCTSMKGKGTKFTVILPTEVKNTL